MSSVEIPGVDKPTQTVMVIGSDGQPVDFGDGSGTQDVNVTNTSIPVTGPLTDAEFTGVAGLLSAQPYADDTGAGDGSIIGLLKGIYVQNVQIIAHLAAIETNTTPAP